VVLDAVSNFLSSEDERMRKVRKFSEKLIVGQSSDDRFNGYGLGIGRVPSCGKIGGPVDKAAVSKVYQQLIEA
jgi:hypothetical protein